MRSHRKYLYFLIGLSLSIHCERDKEIYLSNPDSISDTSYIPVDTLTICDSLDQGFIDLEQYPSTVKKYRIIFTQKSYIYSINITGDNLYRLSNRIASSFKISADRSKIIFLSENILHIIDNDGENEKELITYDRSLRDIDISRDGEKILYRDSLGINIINSNGENINIIPFPTGVFLRFFSDDMILIHSSGQLLLLDQSGTVVNESPKYFFYTSYVQPIPNTRRVLIGDEEVLYLYDFDLNERIRIPLNGRFTTLSESGEILLGIDSNAILGSNYIKTLISKFTINGSTIEHIICKMDDKPGPTPDISQDSRLIAFTDRFYNDPQYPWDIYLLDLENKVRINLTKTPDVREYNPIIIMDN